VLTAVGEIGKAGGGQIAVADDKVVAMLPLPIAGLMSEQPLSAVHEAAETVAPAARDLGCGLTAPFMTLSFLAPPVISALKLTDKGLVDIEQFEIVPLWAE